ncbi:hypothetical protein EC988_000677 [Linderina pennispora]|nr:hypothetical protein EC988_000677 [Linderina pennispora]
MSSTSVSRVRGSRPISTYSAEDDATTVAELNKNFSKWSLKTNRTEPDAALRYMQHLIATKQSFDMKIETLLPSAYREILSLNLKGKRKKGFTTNNIMVAGANIELQNQAFVRLTRHLKEANDGLQTAMIDYLEMLPDSDKKAAMTQKCLSIIDMERWGAFDSLEFATDVPGYLNEFVPRSVAASNEWKAFMIDTASPLVSYFVKVELGQVTGWTEAKEKLLAAFCTPRERSVLLEQRNATVAIGTCIGVLDYRKAIEPKTRISLRVLAATCTDRQQQVFADILHKLRITNPSTYSFKNLRPYLPAVSVNERL